MGSGGEPAAACQYHRADRLDARKSVFRLAEYHADADFSLPALDNDPSLDRLGVHRRHLGRRQSRRLRSGARRLLGGDRGAVAAVDLWLLSASRILAAGVHPAAGRPLLWPLRQGAGPQIRPLVRLRIPVHRLRFTLWWVRRPGIRRVAEMGRAAADAGDGCDRHRVLDPVRHRAGAGPAQQVAGDQSALHRLHRVHSRRAAGHAAVLRQCHAAAVPAGRHEYRQLSARRRRRLVVRLGLYGGGDPRRVAGDPVRPV